MLKKLLKYDFKALLKYWWIGAVASIVLSLVGGWGISVLYSDKSLPELLYVVAGIMIFIVVLGFIAFLILGTVLIFVRFYKNLFSDEGYLTFTLPVKCSSVLNSKLISSCAVTLLSVVILLVDVAVMFIIGFYYKGIFSDIIETARLFIQGLYVAKIIDFAIIMFIEFLVLMVLVTVFQHLFMFSCITLASIVTKKAKVITSIAIYYGATSLLTFVVMLLELFCVPTIAYWFSDFEYADIFDLIPTMGLIVLLVIATLCAMLYAFQYWLLDKRLNLS